MKIVLNSLRYISSSKYCDSVRFFTAVQTKLFQIKCDLDINAQKKYRKKNNRLRERYFEFNEKCLVSIVSKNCLLPNFQSSENSILTSIHLNVNRYNNSQQLWKIEIDNTPNIFSFTNIKQTFCSRTLRSRRNRQQCF